MAEEGEEVQLFDFSRPRRPKRERRAEAARAGLPCELYPFEQMLERGLRVLEQVNPYVAEARTINLRPIVVDKTVPKKPRWVNFKEFADILKRPMDHLSKFVSAEVGLEAKVADDKLKFEGLKVDKDILQTAVTKYVQEYVRCRLCNSMHTVMEKDSDIRKLVIKCETCHATRTPNPLIGGVPSARR